MEARGRGAGINKPAWLVQKEREEAAAAAASGGDNVKVENGSENNTNGGTSSEIKTEKGEDNNTNGKFDDAPNPDQPPFSNNGYDERDQFGRNAGMKTCFINEKNSFERVKNKALIDFETTSLIEAVPYLIHLTK